MAPKNSILIHETYFRQGRCILRRCTVFRQNNSHNIPSLIHIRGKEKLEQLPCERYYGALDIPAFSPTCFARRKAREIQSPALEGSVLYML